MRSPHDCTSSPYLITSFENLLPETIIHTPYDFVLKRANNNEKWIKSLEYENLCENEFGSLPTLLKIWHILNFICITNEIYKINSIAIESVNQFFNFGFKLNAFNNSFIFPNNQTAVYS